MALMALMIVFKICKCNSNSVVFSNSIGYTMPFTDIVEYMVTFAADSRLDEGRIKLVIYIDTNHRVNIVIVPVIANYESAMVYRCKVLEYLLESNIRYSTSVSQGTECITETAFDEYIY